MTTKPEILRYKKTTIFARLNVTRTFEWTEFWWKKKSTYYIDYKSKYTWNRNPLQKKRAASATSYVHYSMEVVLDNYISAKN